MMLQSLSVAITWPTDADRQISVTVGNASPKQAFPSPIEASAAKIDERSGALNAENLEPEPRVHMIRLAADPACRCQISRPSICTRSTNWLRIRFAMKWASRLNAIFDGYAVTRDLVIPITATLTALFFM